ncbi:11407_t:CDS:2 [Racocetra fulgida]|uniref:11407_t:CDS:1 n=1 Tax=Racocetra fulgida TaxID=60492 RepID=A0A9N9F5C0_9GLOM|nr:11407_t:CDS:2 [Racocetra fulgida]
MDDFAVPASQILLDYGLRLIIMLVGHFHILVFQTDKPEIKIVELNNRRVSLNRSQVDLSCLEQLPTPGKRPLSSTVPTIVDNEEVELELVLGGAD